MWTNADGNTIDEPFESDRHALEADSFFDLQVSAGHTNAHARSRHVSFLSPMFRIMNTLSKEVIELHASRINKKQAVSRVTR